jgi:lysophospholipase L1-like esterase
MKQRYLVRATVCAMVGLLPLTAAASQSASAAQDHQGPNDSAIPQAAPYKYVALGDSFSSGEGSEPYFQPSNQCHRSTTGYATAVELPGMIGSSIYQMKLAGQPGIEWGFQACSGATTTAVLSSGLHGDPIAQLELDRSKDTGNDYDLPVDAATSLVTMTIGGNDIGFSSFMNFCAFSKNCTTEKYEGLTFAQRMQKLRAELSPKLDKIYSTIKTRAPGAKVLVLGYPQLFPATAAEQNCATLAQKTYTTKVGNKKQQRWVGYSRAEQKYLRQVLIDLNQLIAERARANGVQFVPVDSYFAGHEVCGQRGEWINGPSAQRPTDGQNWLTGLSFHPNNAGQLNGYAAAINAQINPR